MLPLAMIGISAGLSALQGGSAAKRDAQRENEQRAFRNANTTRQFVNEMDNNVGVNKTIAESNLKNTIRTGYRAGILNVQRGQAKVQAVRNGYDLKAKGVAVLGQNAANAAAAGNIGASVDAVTENIQLKMDAAQGDIDSAWDTQQHNFNMELSDIVQSGQDSLRYAQLADYTVPELSGMLDTGSAFTKGAVAGAVGSLVQSGSSYAMSSWSLGLGAKSGSLTSGLSSNAISGMSTNNTGNRLPGSWQ